MDQEKKDAVVRGAFGSLPYVGIAGVYAWLVDGTRATFWAALGVISAVAFLFFIVDTLSAILAWRLYFKPRLIARYVGLFRNLNFPPKQFHDDDLGNYLARISADADEFQRHIAHHALDHEGVLLAYEKNGILVGMRHHAAAEAGFEQYRKTLPRASRSRFDIYSEAA